MFLKCALGFIAPLKVHGYDGLVQGLLNGLDTPDLVVDVAADGVGRNLRADIVLLPYDFRLGVEPAARRLAAEVTARLKALGYRSLFLDFDPEDGIPAGRSWEQELYQQLRESRAVIVLCSEHSMRWQTPAAERSTYRRDVTQSPRL